MNVKDTPEWQALHHAVRQLANVADTSNGMATWLRKRHVKGIVSRPTDCPISRILRRTSGLKYVRVGAYFASWAPDVLVQDRIELPAHVAEFVARFDRGHFPELIDGRSKAA